ncbi:MAG: PilZ domain-containing protein [Gammaproteobacteria bacterium]|nr:PilZ domain-containing protein [Gammaproteobacteria bacterium]
MTDDQQKGSVEDRRQFFRIDDRVTLSYQTVPPGKLAKRLELLDKGLDSEFSVMGNLATISQEMSGVLRKIETGSPEIARYLKSLDHKIELLGRAFLAWTSDLGDQPASTVNLSANGMAFTAVEPLTVGSILELKLLLPSFTGLVVYAEVVACEKLEPETGASPVYQARVTFKYLRESDRDVLIRHVLQRQGEFLRKRREERDS